MLPYPKRLIEVDLPIKRISAHARREKSIRHGHISTLHIWWARRPLAACRAVICAALWPDPADPLCPQAFRDKAAELMTKFAAKAATSKLAETCSPDSLKRWVRYTNNPKSAIANLKSDKQLLELRSALLDFIADFANWDNSTVKEYLETSRALTQAAHEALGGEPGTRPLVVDPFAGGGSIPLEALRVGADAFASDLNPVAVLLNKVVLEYIPKYGQRLADEVRKWGEWIKKEAEKELAEFYPCLPAGRPKTPDEATPGKFSAYVLRCSDGSLYKGQTDNLTRRFKQHCNGEIEWTKNHLPVDLIHFEEFDTREEAVEREKWLKSGIGREWLMTKFPKETPIAYLWARTIKCEGPGCGAEVPLMRSLWLAKKSSRSVALQIVPDKKHKRVDFEIIERRKNKWVKQNDPKSELHNPQFDGTVRRGSSICPVCSYTTPVTSVRAQLKKRKGGAADARLYCVVTTRNTEQGRFYRLPTERDIKAVRFAAEELERRKKKHKGELSLIPDEELDVRGIRHTWAMIYGIDNWGDIFPARQSLALCTLVEAVRLLGSKTSLELAKDLELSLKICLALAIDRQADSLSSLTRWQPSRETNSNTFSRQALPMVWDFAEPVPISDSAGSLGNAINWILTVFQANSCLDRPGHIQCANAVSQSLPDDSASALITDPPYYDSVPYSYLSDFSMFG